MRGRPAGPADRAFVLRVATYGEADAVVTLLTARDGVIAAIAKRARALSTKRRWVLEPFHTLSVEIAPGAGELAHLRGCTIGVARALLLESARAMEAAGEATRWVRWLCPPHAPEPEVFDALETLFDSLVERPDQDAALAAFGLQLLEALGYGLELSTCARCARPRPKGRAAFVTAQSGGVLCESCRMGIAADEPAFSGDLLDAVGADAANAANATPDAGAELLRIVRRAIDLRAQAVGTRTAAR